MHGRLVTIGGIAQHTDFSFWEIVIAQRDGVLNDTRKVGVHGGFAITSKGDDIGTTSIALHLLERLLQFLRHLFA